MLYYLFEYLGNEYGLAGAGLFQYISFRSAMAFGFSLLISTIYGRKVIDKLRRLQVGETIRDLGLDGQKEKSGTPTMGGIIIILSTIIPVLLFAQLDNIYIIILIVTTLWMGAIGFIEDYIKVFKKDKPTRWVCRNCGYVHEGVEAPGTCPACAHPQAHFELLGENW